jgi:hypothetical protein
VSAFLDWADKRNIVSVRSTVLFFTVWMTWRMTEWAFVFTNTWLSSTKNGIETSAVVSSVIAPLVALQVFAFNAYMRRGK